MSSKKHFAFFGSFRLALVLTVSLMAALLFLLRPATPLFAAGQIQGRVGFSIPNNFTYASAVIMQPDGRVVVGGGTRSFPFGAGGDFALNRLLPSGALDNSFDGDGRVTTNFTNAFSAINALALQPDGKIIAAGITRQSSTYSAAFARYNPNGSLDTTFNGTGKFLLGPTTFVTEIAILPDGKILGVGAAGLGNASDFMLMRLNSDGTLDNTFGSGGVGTTPISKGADQINALAVQPDGKIVVAGTADFGGAEGNTFVVVRYTPDGDSDPTFDDDGFTITDFGGSGAYALAVALQADGKIVAAGYSQEDNLRAALVRFNPDGSYDNSFGAGGKIVIPAGTLTASRIYALAIQSNGKLVGVGAGADGSASGSLVLRFRRDGSPDTSFDGDGVLVLPTSPGWRNAAASAVAIQPNSSIRLVGSETTDKTAIGGFIYSIVGDQQTPADFDGDGQTDLSLEHFLPRIHGAGATRPPAVLPASPLPTTGLLILSPPITPATAKRMSRNGAI